MKIKEQNLVEFLESSKISYNFVITISLVTKSKSLRKIGLSKLLNKNSVTSREKTTISIVVALTGNFQIQSNSKVN